MMPVEPTFPEPVAINRIFLLLDNPRHEPFETESQAIDYLCANEQVYALARDIAKHGVNPSNAALWSRLGRAKALAGSLATSLPKVIGAFVL